MRIIFRGGGGWKEEGGGGICGVGILLDCVLAFCISLLLSLTGVVKHVVGPVGFLIRNFYTIRERRSSGVQACYGWCHIYSLHFHLQVRFYRMGLHVRAIYICRAV